MMMMMRLARLRVMSVIYEYSKIPRQKNWFC